MKSAFLSICVSLALLAAPVAHAMCIADHCQTPGIDQQASKIDKTANNDKVEKSTHHCCASHVSAKLETLAVTHGVTNSRKAAFHFDEAAISPWIYGPLLKPPSHA